MLVLLIVYLSLGLSRAASAPLTLAVR